MPKIKRHSLPPALLDHLLDRLESRGINVDQLGLLSDWLAEEPEVPYGLWFKRFPGMTVCGEGQLIKTFLTTGQIAVGQELK